MMTPSFNFDGIRNSILLFIAIAAAVSGCTAVIRPHVVFQSDLVPLYDKISVMQSSQFEMRLDQLSAQEFTMDQMPVSSRDQSWYVTYERVLSNKEIVKDQLRLAK